MKGKCFPPNCKESITCFFIWCSEDDDCRMWFECSAAPVFSTFWSKTSWNVSQRRNDTEGPAAKMHPPTYHLASLDPIEVYFNPKGLPPKADTDIFSISLILPFFVTFHPKAHLEIFNSSEQIFFVVNLFCLSAFIYLLRISVCSNLVGRQIQSWT